MPLNHVCCHRVRILGLLPFIEIPPWVTYCVGGESYLGGIRLAFDLAGRVDGISI